MTKPAINVLLVEDNPADVVFLREALSADALATFDVTIVERLSAALDILQQRAFGVILIDLGLPDSQGLATFTRVHQDFPDLPVVILSGLTDETLALQTVQAGAQDYLVKNPVGFAASARAIRYAIERHQAQIALRASELRFKSLFEHSPVAYQSLDEHGLYIDVNNQLCQLTGYSATELLGVSFGELWLPAVRPKFWPTFERFKREGAVHAELQLVRKDGALIEVLLEGRIQRNLPGQFVRTHCILHDITERKRQERALRQWADAFENCAHGIDMSDPATNTISVCNAAFARLHGRTVAEIQGMPILSVYAPADHDHVRQSIQHADQTGHCRYEARMLRKDGSTYPVQMDVVSVRDEAGNLLYRIATEQDIAERKQGELALRQSEADLAEAQRVAQIGNWRLDITTNALTWSAELYRIFEVEKTGFGGKHESFISRVHPDDRGLILETNRKAKERGEPFDVEYRIITSADQLKYIREIGYAQKDDAGAIVGLFGIAQDITERKQAEAALRLSEEKYRGLMESLDSVIATVDYDGRCLYINDTAAGQLGRPAPELIGKTLFDLFPEAVAAQQIASVRQVIDQDRSFDYESESIVDGRARWYRVSIQPIHNETGRVIHALVNATDIHSLKTTQQELIELTRTLEARVQQRTAEVQDLYENAPAGYHSLDADGNFIIVNQTELNWLGYTRAELIGRPVKDIFTAQSLAIFQRNFPVFKQCGWLRDLELEFIRKDGSVFPILVSATAIYDNDGNYMLSRSTVLDITERKQAEIALRESEEQNRLLFEVAPEAVVLFDENGVMVRLNRAFEQLTGYTQAQLTGHTLDELGLLPAAQIEQLAKVVVGGLASNDDFQTVEFSLRRADGERREIGTRVFSLKVKDRQHYLTTMRDITIEKQAEEALRLANAELMRAARAKDEFLATMSHELRTPLNAILGLSEALLEEVRGPLNERQQASLRNIEVSGRHLLTLINDILDLSKVESGRLELQIESITITDVCQASLLFVKETAIKKQLQLAFLTNNQLAKVEADSKRLKQMLVNLLSNAVKFTPAGGQISLEVNTDAEMGITRFMVRDTGIGIASADMSRLFQPFTQLDSGLSRQHEGTGLGLALVRRLAELHGGSVSVESEAGRGSCFTIALPYHPSAAESTGSPAMPSAGNQPQPGLRVLVVEDSDSSAEQIARYLQEMNLRPTVHLQSESVLARVISLNPDVILLDLLMPEQSGWAVLAQLKADVRTRAIPVIIISVVDERANGLAAGAAEYLVKPISRETLRQALTTVAIKSQKFTAEALVVAPQSRPASLRVLLAEDSEANILPISDYLISKGYQLAVARNGLEALDYASTTHPDLILMDIQMPELDGLEVIRRLRAWPEFAGTPIIALTALAMPGDRERCLAAGADEYLTKPVRLKSLVDAMERLLQKEVDGQ